MLTGTDDSWALIQTNLSLNIILLIYLFVFGWVFITARAFLYCSEPGLLSSCGAELLVAVVPLVVQQGL